MMQHTHSGAEAHYATYEYKSFSPSARWRKSFSISASTVSYTHLTLPTKRIV